MTSTPLRHPASTSLAPTPPSGTQALDAVRAALAPLSPLYLPEGIRLPAGADGESDSVLTFAARYDDLTAWTVTRTTRTVAPTITGRLVGSQAIDAAALVQAIQDGTLSDLAA